MRNAPTLRTPGDAISERNAALATPSGTARAIAMRLVTTVP